MISIVQKTEARVFRNMDSSSSDDDVPLAQIKAKANKDKTPKKAAVNSSAKKAKEAKEAKKVVKKEQSASQPVKRERKTYDMPGQTRDTPDENDPLRRFYESLHTEKPKSEMARKWCVVHGLLPLAEAKKWVAVNGRGSQRATQGSQGTQGSQSPAKRKKPAAGKKKVVAAVKKSAEKKARVTSPSRVRNDRIEADSSEEESEDEDEDDFESMDESSVGEEESESEEEFSP